MYIHFYLYRISLKENYECNFSCFWAKMSILVISKNWEILSHFKNMCEPIKSTRRWLYIWVFLKLNKNWICLKKILMNKSEINSSVSDEVSNSDHRNEDERYKETVSTLIQQFNSLNFIFKSKHSQRIQWPRRCQWSNSNKSTFI